MRMDATPMIMLTLYRRTFRVDLEGQFSTLRPASNNPLEAGNVCVQRKRMALIELVFIAQAAPKVMH